MTKRRLIRPTIEPPFERGDSSSRVLGDVVQFGGEVNVGALHLGDYGSKIAEGHFARVPEDYGRGFYRMTGGTLTAQGGAVIGHLGVGEFRQEGGAVDAGGVLHIGGTLAELPVYTPPVDLTAEIDLVDDIAPLDLDFADQRVFPSASPHSLVIANGFTPVVPSRGLYELSGGELAADTLLVDRTGRYRQSSGSSEFGFVAIEAEGEFRLAGGGLHAETGFHSRQPLDLQGDEATLSVGAGILNLSSGVAGAHHAHIVAGTDSLTILPAGFDANTGFGTFNRQGMVHVAGRELEIRAGKRIAGAGVIDDRVIARGEIAASGFGMNLNEGLSLFAGAQVDLGGGGLAAVGRPTLERITFIRSGILRVGYSFDIRVRGSIR